MFPEGESGGFDGGIQLEGALWSVASSYGPTRFPVPCNAARNALPHLPQDRL